MAQTKSTTRNKKGSEIGALFMSITNSFHLLNPSGAQIKVGNKFHRVQGLEAKVLAGEEFAYVNVPAIRGVFKREGTMLIPIEAEQVEHARVDLKAAYPLAGLPRRTAVPEALAEALKLIPEGFLLRMLPDGSSYLYKAKSEEVRKRLSAGQAAARRAEKE